jgi:hypothetical protein
VGTTSLTMSGHNDSDDEHGEETYFAGGERRCV